MILSKLSRVTSDGRFIPEVDGLRFLAICSVAMYHLLGYMIEKSPVAFTQTRYESWLGSLLSRGWFGVDLFFVISGFVISLPFARQYLISDRPVQLRSYYLRRLTRLEPTYFICVTILFALHVLVKAEHGLLPHYVSTLTYTHNILYGQKSPVAQVAWSLEIEIQFYIAAPLVTRMFMLRKLSRRCLMTAIIIATCAMQPWLHALPLNVFYFIEFFLTGFLLADFYVTQWQRPGAAYGIDAVGIIAITALLWLTGVADTASSPHPVDYRDPWFSPAWSAGACLGLFVLCWAAFQGRVLRSFLRLPVIPVVGGMCYTIYLYHEYVFSLIGHIMIRVHWTHELWINYWITWALMFMPMLVATSILFLAFEKPFMQRDWYKNLWHVSSGTTSLFRYPNKTFSGSEPGPHK